MDAVPDHRGHRMVHGQRADGLEIDTYLAARKAQGFNAIQFMLMSKHLQRRRRIGRRYG